MLGRKRDVKFDFRTNEDNHELEYNENDLYSEYHKKEEVNQLPTTNEINSVNNDNSDDNKINYNNEDVPKTNYLETHTVVSKGSKYSRLLLTCFYVLALLICVGVFFLMRNTYKNSSNQGKENNQTNEVSEQQVKSHEVTLSTTSLSLSKGQTAKFTVSVSGAIGIIVVSSNNTNVLTLTTADDSCNGMRCFFDAEVGKIQTVEFIANAIGTGTTIIDVKLEDLVSYDDSAKITDSGKISVIVK